MEKVITIKNLNYSYPDGTKALSGINLDILKADTVAIAGPNGAGKTTLLLHLNGILMDGKSIEICGLPVNQKNLPAIRQKVGVVFQDPEDQLFMPTVFEDVAFGPLHMGVPREKIEEKVDKALEAVDMKAYKQRISHHLSYGEKKRISLATILSMTPEIVVFDEPTGNLDPRHRKEFVDFLRNLTVTKVIATHDTRMIRSVCDKTIVMDKGMIAAYDSTDSILKNEDLVKKYYLSD